MSNSMAVLNKDEINQIGGGILEDYVELYNLILVPLNVSGIILVYLGMGEEDRTKLGLGLGFLTLGFLSAFYKLYQYYNLPYEKDNK